MSDDLAEVIQTASRRPDAFAVDFRTVFDAAPRPLLLIAADPPKFTMLAVNRAHALSFRTAPEALQGHGVLEVFPPDPSAEVAAFADAIRISLNRVVDTAAVDQMPIRPYAVTGADGVVEERYWSAVNTPVLALDGAVTHIISAVQDVTGEVFERRSEAARSLLMREVDHRARNALAVVQSIIRLTGAPSLETFRRIVDGRVEALARAQTSLAARRWEGAILADIVEAELSAMADSSKFRLLGPQVLLVADQVQALSMIVHELATNARKYGALTAEAGRLTITWSIVPDGGLDIVWREEGGPAVEPPSRRGFGSRLILQLTRQLEGDIQYHWAPEGMRAELRLPRLIEPSGVPDESPWRLGPRP